VTFSLSRSGNVRENAAMESFISSLKTEHAGKKIYRTRTQAKANLFDYIECFYNPTRRHSTLGWLSSIDLERDAEAASMSLCRCPPNRHHLSAQRPARRPAKRRGRKAQVAGA